jgi:small subunit ribosomal protein S1
MDFGAFVEIEPGIEGLIHISEMSWGKKIRHPSDVLKQGDRVDAVILSVKPEERRIALGLKQTLADPWLDAQRNFPVGSQVEGPVTKLMNFGAFVQIADGIEGLVHISEIVADRASTTRPTCCAPARWSKRKSSPSTPRSARSSSA